MLVWIAPSHEEAAATRPLCLVLVLWRATSRVRASKKMPPLSYLFSVKIGCHLPNLVCGDFTVRVQFAWNIRFIT